MGWYIAQYCEAFHLLSCGRREGDGATEAGLSGDVRARYVVGELQRTGGYEFTEILAEEGGLFGRCTELQAGY